jgi:hypothetical protein
MRYDLEIAQFTAAAATELAVEEIENLDKFQEEFENAKWSIAQEALDFWKNSAGLHLDTTLNRYQQSLYVYEEFGEGVVVGMQETDKLVVSIEEGAPPYNMQKGLLGGALRKVIPIGGWRDMRVVTAGADSSKWQHPGFRGLNLVDEVDDHIDAVLVPAHLEKIFENL